ncbi:MAG: glycosyltransferase [Cyanobacteriota bacterium]|nr:glycosyltransferase [Cyanobacteriota bacterium]
MLQVPATEYSSCANSEPSPAVSILMMTRNHADFLVESVTSVIHQQFDEPFEILIGEDYSVDHTLHVAQQLRRKYPHLIRVITADQNVGIRSNFLRLVARARAPLLALLEGDDYWTDPCKLRVQCDLIRSHSEYALVAAKTANRQDWLPLLAAYRLPHLLRRYAVHTSTLLIRAEHLLSYPRFPDNVCWESMLLGYLLSRGLCGMIGFEMSYYRRHHGGLWHNANRLQRLEMSRECIDAMDAFFFFRFRSELISREIWIYHLDSVFPSKNSWAYWMQTWNIQLSLAPRLLRRAPIAYAKLLIATAFQPFLIAYQQLRGQLALGARWRKLRGRARV